MESSLEDFNPAGCTCSLTEIPISHDSSRYVVLGHSCPHCREWDRKMREAGVAEKRFEKAENRDQKPQRRKRAA